MSALGGKADMVSRVTFALEAGPTRHILSGKPDAFVPQPQRPVEIGPSGFPAVWGQFLMAAGRSRSARAAALQHRFGWTPHRAALT
jgi:hypothetical protein